MAAGTKIACGLEHRKYIMFGDGGSFRRTDFNSASTLANDSGEPAKAAFDIAEYWRIAVKHRLLIAGAFLASLVGGVALTLLMTPIFTATTTLQIDREAARVIDGGDVNPRESMVQGEEFFQTQYGLLRSRSLAERVIDDLGLASSDAFLDQMGVSPPRRGDRSAAAQAAQRRETVIRTMQKNLGVAPVRGSRLVLVSFDSPDPVLSARIANAVAENFIQSNLDRRYESSSYAREFLEDRIEQTKARLADAERQLVVYATNEQIINVREAGAQTDGTQSLVSTNLSALNASLAEARADRIGKEEKWRQSSGASLFTLPEVLDNPALQRLVEERVRVTAEYEQKSRLYQPDYPEMVQLKSRSDELTRQINLLAGSVRSSIRGEYDVALNRERSLARQVEGLKGDVLDLRGRSVQYGILQREVDTSRSLYAALLQRYNEVGVTGGVTTNNISIVDPADPPSRPSKPRLLVNLILAALAGLGLGVGLAFVLEALDETLASPDDVESKLGLSVLGIIPLLQKGESPKDALMDVRSGFAEAYYSLRTALQFSTPEGAPKTLLVTSSRPAEGKSTTAYATALNLARLGRRVLLADGDLRNPSMHRVVGSENNAGMSNLLSGSGDLRALVQTTDQPGLDFIPCGPIPPNPAELWGGDRAAKVLEDAMQTYDHIVIDGPPVLGFADAPLLASAVRGTVFVLESKGTRRAQARGALRRLGVGNSRILGVVLTKFNTKAVQYGSYDYSYDYNYGASGAGKAGRSKPR
ncbi:GumC family protein [Brevundimonas sp. NPDC092305]|uniref:GumC family protein n=1 Tax=Brevundimonas sp. NPDC092305 TaxID=3363957 RepID=UPI00381DC34C